jgi:hypothetical protein
VILGLPCPLSGVTVTQKFAPARAELLTAPVLLPDCFELTLTSVRRPTTAEGRTTNTLPLPLDVLIPAMAFPMQIPVDWVHVLLPLASTLQLIWQVCPPVMLPPLSITHAVVPPPVPYVKLPLLCARATVVHRRVAPAKSIIFRMNIFSLLK